jgi:hypothetical protein
LDPVPDPLLLRKSGGAGDRTRTSGSVARNSEHWTTEEVIHHFTQTTFQILTEVTTKINLFGNSYVEDGGSVFLRNIGHDGRLLGFVTFQKTATFFRTEGCYLLEYSPEDGVENYFE